MSQDVVLSNQEGTLYLTTAVTGTASADTTATRSATKGGMTYSSLSVTNQDIITPKGFATDLGVFLNGVLSLVMTIAILLVFLQLVTGAINWITSGGDKAKTQKAREKIVPAIIGLLIVAASFALLQFMLRFLGFASLDEVLNQMKSI